jgi:hypothetical protein
MNTDIETITINGVDYVRADQAAPNGNRAVVVIDRGWIYAGDVTEQNGRIRLDRAVWVFRWESIGFAAVVADPDSDKVDIRKMSAPIDIPASAELYRIPVADDWGL